ncbi:MAG: DUF4279 domain-containing protein [Polyangiaceae bacterium]
MCSPQRFISLRVWHPSLSPDEISQSLNMRPTRSWRVGERRTTPKGGMLDGTNKETYCVFDIDLDPAEVSGGLENFFAEVLDPREAAILAIGASAGRVEVFVSWEANVNVGDMFKCELLARLVALRLSLAVEWFPQGDLIDD